MQIDNGLPEHQQTSISTKILDLVIKLREHFIGFFLNIHPEEILNPNSLPDSEGDATEIIGMLKSAVNEFKHVAMDETGSRVNYAKLRQEDCYRDYCELLIPQLHNLDLSQLNDRNEATAFWINLYNTLVVHAVIEYDVQESIGKGGFHNTVRFFRRAAYNVGGQRYSLEDIEHGILRSNRGNPFQFSPNFTSRDARKAFVISPVDPRIHFALNCASKSCPPIGVYAADNLDAQLDLATANFIENEFVLKGNKLSLSQIFNWYTEDFGGKRGLIDFLLEYLPEDERRAYLEEHGESSPFSYTPYNWSLNI